MRREQAAGIALVVGVWGCGPSTRDFEVEATSNCSADGSEVTEVLTFVKFDCEGDCSGYVSTGLTPEERAEVDSGADFVTRTSKLPLDVYYQSFSAEGGGDAYVAYPVIREAWEGRCDVALDELGSDVTCPHPNGVDTCTLRIVELTEAVRD